MKIVFAHFPMSIEVKRGKMYDKQHDRREDAAHGRHMRGLTKVEVKGQDVRVYGISKDAVSQTAANIRLACKIRNKDTRAFQDGVYYEVEGYMMQKKTHPKFNIPNYGTRAGAAVKDRWRKQRGIDNKKRIKRSYAGASPEIGYRNPEELRGIRRGQHKDNARSAT